MVSPILKRRHVNTDLADLVFPEGAGDERICWSAVVGEAAGMGRERHDVVRQPGREEGAYIGLA